MKLTFVVISLSISLNAMAQDCKPLAMPGTPKNETKAQKVQREALEDTLLDTEINEVRAANPGTCFDCKDSRGDSLEKRVVRFAMENKIMSFCQAFERYQKTDTRIASH